VLAVLPRVPNVEQQELQLRLPYAVYEPARRLLAAHGGRVVAEGFDVEVTLQALLPAAQVEAFTAELKGVLCAYNFNEPFRA
jgi:putative IMPACT (imprinted ancient) family translation regulator